MLFCSGLNSKIKLKLQIVIICDTFVTGIREECVFHQLPNFHVTENYPVDVMHDLYEGVCLYDMQLFLHKLIAIFKTFSLETLNSRINSINYSCI